MSRDDPGLADRQAETRLRVTDMAGQYLTEDKAQASPNVPWHGQ